MVHKIKRGLIEVLMCFIVGIIIASPIIVHNYQSEKQMKQLFASSPTEIIAVTVQPGDSVWSLAASHAPEVPLESYIKHVIVFNGLENATLQPGMLLYIPIYK